MLGSLSGKVTARLTGRILVDVSGVGYWVHTGSWQPDGSITTYLYHNVREDASDLYGFENLSMLSLFEKLLTVSGIGPKAALALLSVGTAEQLKAAIDSKDAAFLTAAPGVGNKAAQKVILELAGKLDMLGIVGATRTAHSDLVEALESLGYRPADIQTVVQDLEPGSFESQLKSALSKLSR